MRLGNGGLHKFRDAILVGRIKIHLIGKLGRTEFTSFDQRIEMHVVPEHEQRPIGDEGHREGVLIFAEHELHHQIHILAVRFQGYMVGI